MEQGLVLLPEGPSPSDGAAAGPPAVPAPAYEPPAPPKRGGQEFCMDLIAEVHAAEVQAAERFSGGGEGSDTARGVGVSSDGLATGNSN